MQDAVKELNLIKGLSIFQGTQDLVSYLESTGRFVKPTKLVFKSVNVPRPDGSVQQKDEEFAYCVPFTDQLSNILNCKDVLHCVENPRLSPAGTYHSLLDGSFYKNHPITKKHKNPLCFVLHSDGAELTDLGSSRAGEHGITNISWTLANIYPELRSTDRSINLLATVKTKWLNHERLGIILEDFIAVMQKLASDEGLKLRINNEEMVFYGFLSIVCGDHPAQGFIGGFKETVKADKPCRRCLAAKDVYLKETDISVFNLRTERIHKEHVKAVEEYVPGPPRRKRRANEEHPDPSVRYGVNRRSHLMSVPHFEVTCCLVQDVMHLLPEGLLSHVCRLVLTHVVFVKKSLTLEVIRDRISEFSKSLRVDRPNSNITNKHLKEGLRQSSAQMRKLSILLPLVLRKKEAEVFTFAGDMQYLNLLILTLRIMNLAMAFDLKDSDVDSLKKLISDFHKLILEIDPDIAMGKLHFLHHLPEQIKLFGVLRQQACFRFEAHFAFFKRITKITKNFVNSLLTLSVRHQTRQCHYIMQPSFLYTGHKFGKVEDFPLSIHEPDINMLKVTMCIQNLQKIQETSRITIHSATFTPGQSVVLIDSTKSPLPKFARVQKINILNDKIGFVCQNLKTLRFAEDLHAYEVQLRPSKTYLEVEKLAFKQEILSIRSENKWLVIPQNHRALLT
ncbi:Dehydrodolichyl diphosphate synthase complex subunit Dhdds [Frankliniella fusca]|uniref:Dehydrodolichyl diphosphate synthase complex subunit Dhdds n=1 Tax=Frankliniella fusca TaxID=407009 RepID=A0AAE1L8L8_9NEOP|nr:Dehydrodolichyl diphosphate synthase complex subunit Dhdds [Frankliniella fusca]KAK3917185.1 Dehydrodolichyl diphosphate synthase complex subunit Dhdds [Frankliniella fusca]